MNRPAWLKFNVEFVENGSDADTVGVALSGLVGCVIRVDGVAFRYEGVRGHDNGDVSLIGVAYPDDCGKPIALPLHSGSTITVI
jgi:hypothetical protein